MVKKKPNSTKASTTAAAVMPRTEWIRAAGAFVLVVLAGSALWHVAPLTFWGAGAGMGLLSGALSREPRRWQSAVIAGIATLAVLALYGAAPAAAAGTVAPPEATTVQWVVIPLLAATLALGVSFLRQMGLSRDIIAWALLGTMLLTFCISGFEIIQKMGPLVDVEPPAEQYAFDPVMFQKTFYLMEGGSGFYEAFGTAFEQDARFDAPTRDLAGWRSPTTYWLWTLFAERWSTIMNAFVLLGAASCIGAFFIAWRAFRDSVAAVVPALLLMPYYLFALQRWWFPELEFWATFAAIGSAVAIYSKRETIGIGLAFLAGAMREWLLSALIAGGAQRLASKRRTRALWWAGGSAAIVAGYIVNASIVKSYLVSVGVVPQVGTAGRVGGGGPGFILYTARFCSNLMAHPYAVPWLVLACALLVAVLMTIRRRSLYLPALLIAPLAGFMIFGSSQGPFGETGWNDYYGAVYMPFAFILTAGLADLPALAKRLERTPAGKVKGKVAVADNEVV